MPICRFVQWDRKELPIGLTGREKHIKRDGVCIVGLPDANRPNVVVSSSAVGVVVLGGVGVVVQCCPVVVWWTRVNIPLDGDKYWRCVVISVICECECLCYSAYRV